MQIVHDINTDKYLNVSPYENTAEVILRNMNILHTKI